MISSSILRRILALAACVMALGAIPGCGEDTKPATPPPVSTTPPPVSKAAPAPSGAAGQSSGAAGAVDSTKNPRN